MRRAAAAPAGVAAAFTQTSQKRRIAVTPPR
jgi:hypothetical protein